jgi:hypothetical protein
LKGIILDEKMDEDVDIGVSGCITRSMRQLMVNPAFLKKINLSSIKLKELAVLPAFSFSNTAGSVNVISLIFFCCFLLYADG